MLFFECDYNIGAHPKIIQKLIDTNFEKLSGYGNDPYCKRALLPRKQTKEGGKCTSYVIK